MTVDEKIDDLQRKIEDYNHRCQSSMPGVTEHVLHCCGIAQRYLTGIVGPQIPLGEQIDWSDQETITCPRCGKPVTVEISGAIMSAYRLGGWTAITKRGPLSSSIVAELEDCPWIGELEED